MRNILLSVVFLLASITSAHAGAWLQPEGHGQFIANASYFTSDKYFTSTGDRQSESRYSKYEFQPYLEYGALANLTVGASVALQDDSQSGTTNYGAADPELFLRTALWRDGTQVLSLQPLVKFASTFEHDGTPRGGSKSTDAELSLGYGRSFRLVGPRDYIDLRTGYRYRSGELHDQLSADAVLGLNVAPKWQLVPAVRTIFPTEMTRSPVYSENGDQYYQLVKLELSTLYQMDSTRSFGLTAFDHVDGRQTGDGLGVTLSFAKQF